MLTDAFRPDCEAIAGAAVTVGGACPVSVWSRLSGYSKVISLSRGSEYTERPDGSGCGTCGPWASSRRAFTAADGLVLPVFHQVSTWKKGSRSSPRGRPRG